MSTAKTIVVNPFVPATGCTATPVAALSVIIIVFKSGILWEDGATGCWASYVQERPHVPCPGASEYDGKRQAGDQALQVRLTRRIR